MTTPPPSPPGRAVPEKYYNISDSQLSIARFAGGAKINGHYYVYNPTDDTLTLETVLRKKK